MQKKLIAAAVATLMSGAAMAQVTIYGRLDYGFVDTTSESTVKATGVATETQTTNTAWGQGLLTTSRLGFKVEEDIGGGLKAMGNVELGIANTATSGTVDPGNNPGNSTAPQSVFEARLVNVGLMSSLGTLTLGRQNHLADLAFQAGNAGATNNGVGNAYVSSGARIANVRTSNAITYNSPSLGGLVISGQYGKGTTETTTAGVASEASWEDSALSANFTMGALNIHAAYSAEEQVAANLTVIQPEQITVGASFDLKVVKIYGVYASSEDAKTTLTTDGTEAEVMEIGVRVPMGAFTLTASAYVGENKSENPATASTDTSGFQLGGIYSLSKRTSAYVLIGATEADGPTTNVEGQQFGLGIRHDF